MTEEEIEAAIREAADVLAAKIGSRAAWAVVVQNPSTASVPAAHNLELSDMPAFLRQAATVIETSSTPVVKAGVAN